MTERRRYRSFIQDNARWDRILLRDGDVIIDTPAKSGTTWMQMCCALLVFGDPDLPAPMAELSPWVDMLTWPIDDLAAHLDAQTHRRFLKSHTPLDGLPDDERVTYICVGRDPRDVAISMAFHMMNIDLAALVRAREKAVGSADSDELDPAPPEMSDPIGLFWSWVDNPGGPDARNPGLAAVFEHLQTFWDRRDRANVELFHYADLERDLSGQLRRLAGVLGVEVEEQRWDELVEAATFDSMKANADRTAPDTNHGIWRDNSKFFNVGRSGSWRMFAGSPDDVARYEARVAELAAPDLARWAQHGWLA